MMIEFVPMIVQALPEIISALPIAILLLFLNHRSSRKLEKYKSDLQHQLSEERRRVEELILKRSMWYEKRSKALVDIYGAFHTYLRFLRIYFYFEKPVNNDITPKMDFQRECASLSVFLTDELKSKVDSYAFELAAFWNWAIVNREAERTEIQRLLDFEIPRYLDCLRVDISRYLGEAAGDGGNDDGFRDSAMRLVQLPRPDMTRILKEAPGQIEMELGAEDKRAGEP